MGKLKKTHAIVLAAGVGVRFCSDTPKLLHKLAGKELLLHVLDNIAGSGIKSSTIVGGRFLDSVESLVVSHGLNQTVAYVKQGQVLGTGHAVGRALSSIPSGCDTVLIICGDTPLIDRGIVKRLVAHHHKGGYGLTILSAMIDQKDARYGRIERDPRGNVVRICEEKGLRRCLASREVNAGTYCVNVDVLKDVVPRIKKDSASGEYLFTDSIDLLVASGKKVGAYALQGEDAIVGVNTRQDMARADAFIQQKTKRTLMDKGVTLTHPDSIYIEADVTIGKDTVIKPFTYIERFTRIGKRCSIGPFCHIRPYSEIQDEVHLGNFVEIKKSKIGLRSKVNHLSYIGDTQVGQDVNIGAGTITANYDGKNKFPTIIEDEVFSGCNTVFIAPVTVGKGAKTGAGSVVRSGHDVPPKATVVGVPARELKK